jgi:hypothetical protein
MPSNSAPELEPWARTVFREARKQWCVIASTCADNERSVLPAATRRAGDGT